MKIEARAWSADALSEDSTFCYLPGRCGARYLRRWLSWRHAIRRHASALWFITAVLVLCMSWMKACTSTPDRSVLRAGRRTRTRVAGAIASTLSRRHATDDSVP